MKLFKRFSILAALALGCFIITYLLNPKVNTVTVNVTPEAYLINGKHKSLAEVVEIVKGYENQGYQICLESKAAQEKVSAITDKIRGIPYKSKGFTNKEKCQ